MFHLTQETDTDMTTTQVAVPAAATPSAHYCVKIKLETCNPVETRRFALPRDNCTLASLAQLCSLPNTAMFSYLDQEGDAITVGSDEELMLAFQEAQAGAGATLKLTAQDQFKPKAKPVFDDAADAPADGGAADTPALLTVCVDRSGSMRGMHVEAVGGVNSFIEDQKLLVPQATLSIITFDDKIEAVCSNKPVTKAPPATAEMFKPRGMTALFDGINQAMDDTESRLIKLGCIDDDATIVCVIMTDGQENSSRASRQQTFKRIDDKKALGWQFIFLGANQDAMASGASYGMDRGSCVTYSSTGAGQSAAWTNTNMAVGRYYQAKSKATTPALRKAVKVNFSATERVSCMATEE